MDEKTEAQRRTHFVKILYWQGAGASLGEVTTSVFLALPGSCPWVLLAANYYLINLIYISFIPCVYNILPKLVKTSYFDTCLCYAMIKLG